MQGIRHVRDQTIWESSSVAWPTFTSSAWTALLNNNTLSNLGTGSPSIAPTQLLGPIQNLDNLDFCYVNFQGKINSITTGGAPAGTSNPRWGIIGRPHMGSVLETNPLFADHPAETQTFGLVKATSWWSNAMGLVSANNNATPPYFGMSINLQMSQNTFQAGWPFCGVALAAEDRWSLGSWAGWQRDGSRLSISGMQEFWIVMRFQNPTLTAGNPSAMNISGIVVAHMFEHRMRR